MKPLRCLRSVILSLRGSGGEEKRVEESEPRKKKEEKRDIVVRRRKKRKEKGARFFLPALRALKRAFVVSEAANSRVLMFCLLCRQGKGN